MRSIISILLLLSSLFFVSCEMYPDGGLVRKVDDRLTQSWRLSQYLRNGNDETDLVQITEFIELYYKDGGFGRVYTKPDQSVMAESSGNWVLSDDNMTVTVSGISSISEFSAAHPTLSPTTYTIKRLKKDELWVSFEDGGSTHEFRMVIN